MVRAFQKVELDVIPRYLLYLMMKSNCSFENSSALRREEITAPLLARAVTEFIGLKEMGDRVQASLEMAEQRGGERRVRGYFFTLFYMLMESRKSKCYKVSFYPGFSLHALYVLPWVSCACTCRIGRLGSPPMCYVCMYVFVLSSLLTLLSDTIRANRWQSSRY